MRQMKEKICKIKRCKYISIIKNKVSWLMVLVYIFLSNGMIYVDAKTTDPTTTNTKDAAGSAIATSKFGTGTQNIFTDLSTYLLILSPIIGAVLGVYFFIRKSAADEQDQKQWNKRLITTGICVVGAVLVSSMIKVITGYYE